MKLTAIFLCSIFISFTLFGQDENEEERASLKDKIVIDGNLSLQFGTFTLVGGNPQIGYRFTDRIVAGVGYSYYLNSFRAAGVRFNDKLHGPTAFGRVLVNESLFIRSDYQNLTYILDNASDAPPETFNRDRLYLGGGYRTPISNRIYATVGVYLDVLDQTATPFFRAGIEAGLGNW